MWHRGEPEDGPAHSQHEDGDGKRGLGLLAVLDVARLACDAATLPKVPRRRARSFGVGLVGSSLAVDADGPQRRQDDVDDQAEQRVEELHDEENALDEEDEQGQDRDDDVPVGDAGTTRDISIGGRGPVQARLTIGARPSAPWEWAGDSHKRTRRCWDWN